MFAGQILKTDHVATPSTTVGDTLGDGPIAAGDTLDVQVFDMPELTVHAQVSPSGEIPMPLINQIRLAGLTSTQAANSIALTLKSRALVRDPRVIVTVQRMTDSFTVLGEVRSPGIYPSYGKRSLADVISMAGGLTDRAGHLIKVSGAPPESQTRTVLWDPTLLERHVSEPPLAPGDTVTVSRCGVVYVGGNVTRPGAYPICESAHTTLAEVIALAQGIRPSTSYKNTVLIRSTDGVREVQRVPLDRILKGQERDTVVQADDIVYVAPSAFKAAVKRTVDVAIAFASTASIYGFQ